MPQTQIQEQRQEQRQLQSISAQQLLVSQLVELPIQQLGERVEIELHDNPALECSVSDDDGLNSWGDSSVGDDSGPDTADDYDEQREREERSDALDAALEGIGRDDEDLPVYQGGRQLSEETEQMVYGEEHSFQDKLMEQVGEMDLNERDRYFMEYVIQSLDDDGLLRTPLSDICEQLAIYHGVDISESQAERLLHRLQQMDPAGIGARTLQECLLLQVERRISEKSGNVQAQTDTEKSGRKDMGSLMLEVLSDHFDEFTKKHWDRIRQSMGLSEETFAEVLAELRRLNPKPGTALGETMGRSVQQILPDFIVDTHDDGSISFSLNSGDTPRLEISQSFADLLKEFQNNKGNMTRQQKEALLYTKQKMVAAQSFIDAVATRQQTLTKTMKAIIQLQKPFFEEGDEELLRPMILKDVAAVTGQDLSTISRVSNSKYVQTRWGTFPLKFFFSDGYVTQSGEELSTRKIKAALRDIIDHEDKSKPLSDDILSSELERRGYPIARRTVAKYREQMGIPVARLRKP